MFNKKIEILSSQKENILKKWLSSDDVVTVLTKHYVNHDFFIKNYANSVIDYYFGVALNTQEIGDCPVMKNLIKYLKGKDFNASELFILCNGFREALITVCFELDLIDQEFEQKISYIFGKNFAGVLDKYFVSIKEVEEKLDRTNSIVDKYIIISKTDLNGIITYASDAFCEISGFTRDELIGQSHSIIRHPEMPKEIFEDMWRTIQAGFIWHGEVKNKKKSGDFYWVNTTIEPIFDENNKITGYDAIRQDITSQKELQSQQTVLIEQSKSAAMGEMISMIAHQWRQPLQAVSILVQKLPITKMIEGELTDEFVDKVVDDVGLQLDYMSKTIDDFRDFFRPDRSKDEVQIYKMAQKAKEFLAPMLKTDSIQFTVIGDENIKILTYINEFVQVLINIIKNARDVMIERKITERSISIRYYKSENNAIVEIEDNAGGIPQNIIGKIFDPYFSTKTSKNGTGLGLYMSKTIIEKHCNGTIFVKNGENGAIFTIVLPLNIVK